MLEMSNLLTNPTAAQIVLKSAVGGIGKSPVSNDGKDVEGEDSDNLVKKVPLRLMDGVALGGIVASCASMKLTASALVDVASWITVIFCPYAAYQKRKVASLGGFRGQLNTTREHVNELQIENNKLHTSVDRLEVGVSRLESVEKELSELCNTTNLDRLTYVVKENGRILKQIKSQLEAQVIQNVMTAVMMSDLNRDLMMGPHELNFLVMRMQNMTGVDFNEQLFREHVKTHGDNIPLSKIMDVLRNLLDDDVPEEENIFKLKPEEILEE